MIPFLTMKSINTDKTLQVRNEWSEEGYADIPGAQLYLNKPVFMYSTTVGSGSSLTQ